MLCPYAKTLLKVALQHSHVSPRWDDLEPRVATRVERGLVPANKVLGQTREIQVPLPMLPFQVIVTWFTEGCRYHILKSDPQNQLLLAVVLLRTSGVRCYDKISLSLKHLHQEGSKVSCAWVCSPLCCDGSHGQALLLAVSAFSVRVTWNSEVLWAEERLE